MDSSTGIVPTMNIGNDGWGGGNSFVWIFGLLILLGMFNGGWGNWNGGPNQNMATSSEVQRGFDTQNTMAYQREILNSVNSTFHDTVSVLSDKYSELQRDVAGVASTLSNCCSETKQLIQQSNYDAAMRDANTNANFTAQIQGIKDQLAQNKIEALQSQVNALNLQNQLAGVVRYPMTTTYGVPSPCFGGCGCGNI